MSTRLIALTLTCLTLSTTALLAAAHTSAPVMEGQLNGESYLVDASQMTLYTFDNDDAGVSNCYDMCAINWPPLLSEPGMDMPAGFTLIERRDGSQQVAYQNEPLYLWINDAEPGDRTGDGVNGVWHIARP